MASRHFRAGVVALIVRDDGAILAFERADVPGSWQLPQGGLETAEQPVDAQRLLFASDGKAAGLNPLGD